MEEVFNAGLAAALPPVDDVVDNGQAMQPAIADGGTDGVVLAGQPVALPGADDGESAAAEGAEGALGRQPDDNDGGDAEDGPEITEVQPEIPNGDGAPVQAQGALMRILLAWSSAVGSHMHTALRQALTAHVWENREWVFEPYS